MIQRKLSKAQGYTIQVLATQLTQSQMAVVSAQEALNEQAELLRISFKLPEGEARFGQDPDGWTLVVTAEPEPKTLEIPDPTPYMKAELERIAVIEAEMLKVKRDGGKLPGPEETKAADDA